MEYIISELGIQRKNIFTTPSESLFTAVIHNLWLKKWINSSSCVDSDTDLNFTAEQSQGVAYPYRKIFIKVLNKKNAKVLPLPRFKLNECNNESLTFPQLLQYVSQNNHRNLWKEAYKKYCHNPDCNKESAVVTLIEHDELLLELILRVYGCNNIKLKTFDRMVKNKVAKLRSYDTHANLMAAICTLETESNIYIIFNNHYENTLLDCLNFSPSLIDKNYTRSLFVIYQILNMAKAMGDLGLSIGPLSLEDIYLSENLWLQIVPVLTNNINVLDESLINENKPVGSSASKLKNEEGMDKNDTVKLEKLCMLWVRGRISNLDYLLHLNLLAGRKADDPQCHFVVPWVTDFSTRFGKNWRDLTKSKYRLTKGDRQLDLTYEVTSLEDCPEQIPHHVTDSLSDITCYVYLARRTPKEVLCKHVRNKWVPAEYPASIQRMQEWTPDECIPEFYTDPLVFKSIHEDLPDLEIPSWSSCVEDFVTKHREALESSHVSENLHHWIDLTFGYKLSGPASIKAKNVCLSLVDGHTKPRRGSAVQILYAPHPARLPRAQLAAPPRLHWTFAKDSKRQIKTNDSSDGASDEDEESNSVHQHVSRLSVPSSHLRARHKSSHRTRSLSKTSEQDSQNSSSYENRASSHSRHYRVQKSELGKGIIYLPKEYNPVSSIQALENLDHFTTKCFFSKSEDLNLKKENVSMINFYPNRDTKKDNDNLGENSFTNRMFLYEQNYLKKFNYEAQILKDRKIRRAKFDRYTADATIYKQFVTDNRKKDMVVIGCLIVEIFLHTYMRPLRLNSDKFIDRCNNCRTVLKYNFHSVPKCVSYIASLLLDVLPLSLNSRTEISLNKSYNENEVKKVTVTDKGLPPPTAAQLLQPLLSQHLIPFPQSFTVLYNLLSTLHEYKLATNDLKIMYTYECDGIQCDMYQNVDKTKLYFSQRISEGKIQTCATHLDALLGQITCFNQFDVLDIFLAHYIELLENRETSVLAAWYLFDTVSKALGPAETRKKLLKHILNLYDDDDYIDKTDSKCSDAESGPNSAGTTTNRHKFVKLYHNIFLLQLMVRLGLQCFLDNFTQHLVEAVGGYKDSGNEAGSPGHLCHDRISANKKPRYSDDTVKNALISAADIFSPDTSYGSEQIITPNKEKVVENDSKDADNRSENELFHLEMDKERMSSRSSRSKSPSESLDSYTLSAQQDVIVTPSPSAEIFSPKEFVPNPSHFSEDNRKTEVHNPVSLNDNNKPTIIGPVSPNIEIPKASLFTSYLHFADDEPKSSNEDHEHRNKVGTNLDFTHYSRDSEFGNKSESNKISDMSSESLLWLSHRLGPVLTCRYITKNLLKMLTLCYIGKDNLLPIEGEHRRDEFDAITIANSRVSGDRNALKVIKCLTSIVVMYGEQVILFQYLPHMGELIASCRRRLSAPLEGGVVACLQLLKYLVPLMSDVKLMEQLQDTFLKSILHPTLRLLSTTRCTFPNGVRARTALARKFLDTLYVVAVRIGPEMTRKHLCVPALQRFFLTFDKASGKIDNWPKTETDRDNNKSSSQAGSSEPKVEGFLEICRDGTTAEWSVRDGLVVRDDAPPDVSCSPPELNADCTRLTAQEELLMAFNEELAHQAFVPFMRFVGSDTLERSLKNNDTIQALCIQFDAGNTTSPSCKIIHDKRIQPSLSDDTIKKIETPPAQTDLGLSNSFGSNVTVVGNRIDVVQDSNDDRIDVNALDVVSHKTDNGIRSNRHLRGNWLIYWEHEIGRPDKENRLNLKQIKLQQFSGHTHSVRTLVPLDNEGSFISGSKDKTVRLWSLRNQGDGNATSQCNWTYTGHKKGILSLTFLDSLRLAVSTDSIVHIWDPFMETVVSQLDNLKSPISIVRTLPGPSTAVVCATSDGTIKLIDARTCNFTHELKVPSAPNTLIRCMCVSPNGRWVCAGLASGHIVVLDTRTGMPLATWKAHDGEVLTLAPAPAPLHHRTVVSSGLDQTSAVWSVGEGELVALLKGNSEPVHCLAVHEQEVITGTTNNRIGVHSLPHNTYNSSRLRADSFKGNLVSMAVLPKNRLLLLGSDNGTINLLC